MVGGVGVGGGVVVGGGGMVKKVGGEGGRGLNLKMYVRM